MIDQKGLLEAIQSVISTLQAITVANKPLFNHIDIWNRQADFMQDGTGYNVKGPAIFVEFKETSSKQLGVGVNLVDYEITFHIIDYQLNNSPNLDRNLKVFGLRNIVKQKFQLFKADQMGKMMFIRDEQDFSHNNLYHFKTTFKAALVDTWGNTSPVSGTVSNVNLHLGYTQSFFNSGVSFDSVSGGTFSGSLVVYL